MGATKNVKQLEPEVEVLVFVRDLNDPDFYSVLDKLDKSTGVLSGRKAWSFADFKQTCDQHHARAQEMYRKLLAEHVETEAIMQPDDDGSMTPAKDTNGQEIRRLKVIRDQDGKIRDYFFKDQSAFRKAYDELLDISFAAKLTLFSSDELSAIGLSPRELRAFRKLIVDAPK